MVEFNNDSFTITVEGGVEDYLILQNQLLDLLRSVDPNMVVGQVHYAVIDFLQDMKPSVEMAEKMTK